jgi:hypothetical protein
MNGAEVDEVIVAAVARKTAKDGGATSSRLGENFANASSFKPDR